MDSTLLIWTIALVVVLGGEYRAWTRALRPPPWWRVVVWVTVAFCGWSITIGLGKELLLQVVSFLLVLLQAALIIVPVIWIHYRRSLRTTMEARDE